MSAGIPAGSTQARQFVHDSLADCVAERGDLFDIPAVDRDCLEHPEMDILDTAEDPRIAWQRGAGAFHY